MSVDVIKPPSQCTDKELEAFYDLLVRGGEVEERGLRDRVRRAKLLAFHYENQRLVGIAAIKSLENHKNQVFLRAGIKEESTKYFWSLDMLSRFLNTEGVIFVTPLRKS